MGGKAAALPDLNTAWIMDKREFITAMKNKNLTEIVAYLTSINAGLPDDYVIKISDNKYKEIVQQDTLYLCNYCTSEYPILDDKGKTKMESRPTEYKAHTLEIKTKQTKGNISILTGHNTIKVWECSKCKKDNILSKTEIVPVKLAEPYFLGVIPKPPNRSGTLTDRTGFKIKLMRWAWQFYNELAHAMSRYRLEYKPKEEDDDDFMENNWEEDSVL